MIGLLQRVTEARVAVAEREVARIGRGILVLVGVRRGDGTADAARLAQRVLTYRVFPDEAGRMNRSVLELGLGVLLVPQFTLAADTRKGTRASFTSAAAPDAAHELFGQVLDACRQQLENVAGGEFGADMQVSLVNDGPVTFWLES
jgi:D-tyrosyl-tRNA(Tyr) deacylase